LELSGGAFSIDVHNLLAEDDLVVALVTVTAQRHGIAASFSGGTRLANEEPKGDE
jgi:hypothetical protein